ncbi:hypothetical protein [Candidatus Uabimicrobium amorphum]|uniref:Uncharacterized protein n=1 Tax=Uabimicrobium amorphum TaxID=2596890 RepID=A0A5S9IS89_UABAM|nr:hypothetical protein [Candidatus Uabimicrobium amorphum]BBM87203.1 hypothetical protein UABAM_05606 [Candidatus Uabimicrobium amorphum]
MYLQKHWLRLSIVSTIIVEAITCLFRFGFNMASSKDTKFIAKITFGIRIHHGYIGVLLLLWAFFIRRKKNNLFYLLVISGICLVFSDLIHHFLVLWPITGDPHFDLVYPE